MADVLVATQLDELPERVRALCVGAALLFVAYASIAMVGRRSWKHESGLIVSGWLCGATLMIMLFARPDLQYWAMLVVPLQLVGLAFLPSACPAAVSRPIKVTR